MMHQIAPVPNHNGQKASVLAERMMGARHALNVAVSAMLAIQPQGRDYQTGGNYHDDLVECIRRVGVIEAMAHQYEREAIAVDAYDSNLTKARA